MNQNSRTAFQTTVTNTANDGRLSAKSILPLITPEMSSSDNIRSIREVTERVIKLKELIIITRRITNQWMTRREKKEIIKAIAAIPEPQREELIRNVQRLVHNRTNGEDTRKLIRIIAGIPAIQRADVILYAHPLLPRYTSFEI